MRLLGLSQFFPDTSWGLRRWGPFSAAYGISVHLHILGIQNGSRVDWIKHKAGGIQRLPEVLVHLYPSRARLARVNEWHCEHKYAVKSNKFPLRVSPSKLTNKIPPERANCWVLSSWLKIFILKICTLIKKLHYRSPWEWKYSNWQGDRQGFQDVAYVLFMIWVTWMNLLCKHAHSCTFKLSIFLHWVIKSTSTYKRECRIINASHWNTHQCNMH